MGITLDFMDETVRGEQKLVVYKDQYVYIKWRQIIKAKATDNGKGWFNASGEFFRADLAAETINIDKIEKLFIDFTNQYETR